MASLLTLCSNNIFTQTVKENERLILIIVFIFALIAFRFIGGEKKVDEEKSKRVKEYLDFYQKENEEFFFGEIPVESQ